MPVEEAQPGMVLSAAVHDPESYDIVLLKRGYILEDSVIRRLKDIHIENVFVQYPALDELDRHLEPFMSPERSAVYAHIKESFTQSQSVTQPKIPYQAYYSGIRDLITTLLSQGRNPIYLDQMARLGNDTVAHSAGVSHLALLLGIKLERYLLEQRKRLTAAHAKEVVNLGIAGMLHDIGKLQLPPHLRGSHCFTEFKTDGDRRDYESHPRLAFDMIHDNVEPSGASPVLHHHQHFDGSGFAKLVDKDGTPRSIAGTKIHVFSRILQAADLYDRLSVRPGSTQRRSNLEILYDLRTAYAGRIDPVILQTMTAVTPPFPPGTRLQLTDGTTIVVTDVNPEDPYRPTGKAMGKEFGTFEGNDIVLSDPDAPKIEMLGHIRVEPFMPLTFPVLKSGNSKSNSTSRPKLELTTVQS